MVKLGIYLSGSPQCGGTYSYNKTILDSLIYVTKEIPNCELVVYYLDTYWENYLLGYDLNVRLVKISLLSKILFRISRIFKLPVSFSRVINQFFSSLCRNMQAENCALWFFPSQDAISFLFPLPSIVAIHDLMHRYESRFPEIGKKREYAIREYSYSNMARWCKAIFVDSRIGKEQAQESYILDSNKILILPFVAAQLFDQDYIPRQNFKQKYVLPEKYLFYPAQFWLHKNHLNLLKAFNLIKNEFSDVHLVFVGAQKNSLDVVRNEIQNLRLNSRVHVFGFIDEQDIPQFYKKAIALVMPTYCGPTNIPPLEAFKMSCPVLISKVYGMPEQLGEAAIYFDPSSPEDMANKIRLLLNNPKLKAEKIALALKHAKNWDHKSFYQLFLNHVLTLVKTE